MIRKIFNELPIIRRLLNFIFTIARTYQLNNSVGLRNLKGINWPKEELNEKILVAGTISVNSDVIIENLIASSYSSTSRVYSLKCDGLLPACFNCKKYLWDSNYLEHILVNNGPKLSCIACKHRSDKLSKLFRTKSLNYSDFISNKEIETTQHLMKTIKDISSIKKFELNGISIGKHAYAGAVRFYASPFLDRESKGLEIALAYLKAGIQTYFITRRILIDHKISLVLVNHGIYVPQGIIAEVASNLGIKTLCFATGYRNKTYMVSRDKSYHFDMINKLDFENEIENYSEKIINDYLLSRASGTNDWVLFHEQNTRNSSYFDNIIDQSKNNIVLFTNVLWDGDVHFDESIFTNMIEWLQSTVKYLIPNNNNNIIIRIHPGEDKGFVQSRAKLSKELNKLFDQDELQRLKIISSSQEVNSYELAEKSDHIIIYGTKLGIELAALGFKVLTGGPSWTLNKNITIDPADLKEYFHFLQKINDNTFKNLNVDFVKAKKFAFYVFFTRCLRISSVEKRKGDPPFRFEKTSETVMNDDLAAFKKFINS